MKLIEIPPVYLLFTPVVPGMNMPGTFFSSTMNQDPSRKLRPRILDAHDPPQDTSMGPAVVCVQQPDSERSFQESRVLEAKSEVDSGEFDLHG